MKIKINCYRGCGKEVEVDVWPEGYITVEEGGVAKLNRFTDNTACIDIFCTDCAED